MEKRPPRPDMTAEKIQATHEYHATRQAAIDRIATLRAARLARDLAQSAAEVPAASKKSSASAGKKSSPKKKK